MHGSHAELGARRRRKRLVPVVMQASALDCGPAALQALLGGYGVAADRQRLRRQCAVGRDGSSTDVLEQVARRYGLEARQVLVPVDHVLQPEAQTLPAVAVVRQGPHLTHFVVLWRSGYGRTQVMDPARGRRWPPASRLLEHLYVHRAEVPAAAWRAWAATDDFTAPLAARLAALGIGAPAARRAIAAALAHPGWLPIAALDAAARHVAQLCRDGGLRRGAAAGSALQALTALASAAPATAPALYGIPIRCWFVMPALSGDDSARQPARPVAAAAKAASPAPPGAPGNAEPSGAAGEPLLAVRGAVLVTVRSTSATAAAAAASDLPASRTYSDPLARPLRHLATVLMTGQAPVAGTAVTAAAVAATIALAVASVAAVAEPAVLWRTAEVIPALGSGWLRRDVLVIPVALCLALLLAETAIAAGAALLGRRLETLLGMLWRRRLGQLADSYFASRLTADLARRAFGIHLVRRAPELAAEVARGALELALATAAIVWLDPAGTPLAVAAAAAVLVLPLLAGAAAGLRDCEEDCHRAAAALDTAWRDAAAGRAAIRAHGAQAAVTRQHGELLAAWTRAHERLAARAALCELAAQGAIAGVSTAMVLRHAARHGLDAGTPLLVLWLSQIAGLGQRLGDAATARLPALRNQARRLLEPLVSDELEAPPAAGQPVHHPAIHPPPPAPDTSGDAGAGAGARSPGVAIQARGLIVELGGCSLLAGIDLDLAPGSHTALVGPSGAGKSTLLGLLLGWFEASAGELRIDGLPPELDALRRATAWVSPEVRLWRSSLAENLIYGSPAGAPTVAGDTLRQAELVELALRLPSGLATVVGEGVGAGGGRLAAGEAQRVRFGRACARGAVRLALLDEPFRGLDSAQRARLLAAARRRWAACTLLCATHDVGQALAFDRVLVLAAGRIVEQGAPRDLAALPDSHFARLLAAERRLAAELWQGRGWRRLRLAGGRIARERRAP